MQTMMQHISSDHLTMRWTLLSAHTQYCEQGQQIKSQANHGHNCCCVNLLQHHHSQ
jgi:hypothetical protein